MLQKKLYEAYNLHQNGDLDAAKRLYEEILKNDSQHVDALHLLGLLSHQNRAWIDAERFFNSALILKPDFSQIYGNYAAYLKEQQRSAEALTSYLRSLHINPEDADLNFDVGVFLHDQTRFSEAVNYFEKALNIRKNYVSALSNRGASLRELHRYDEARSSFDEAIMLDPSHALAYSNRGFLLKHLSSFEEALVNYDRALQIDPDLAEANWNKGVLLLLLGNLSSGWSYYEWRKKTEHKTGDRLFNAPLWLGSENLSGKKILIHWEQGLGDTIQFCRYIPQLSQLGAQVLFCPQGPLKALLSSLDANCQIIDVDDLTIEIDYHCPLLSLPLAFKTDLGNLPTQTPYLFADPYLVQRWNVSLGSGGLRIGICWQGSSSKGDFGRSFPLIHFNILAQIPGIRLISLHKGDGESQLFELPQSMTVELPGDEFDSGSDALLDTAAVMMCCDLIITSDTGVAHLAGALGLETWLALRLVPDWRWMLERADTPWYPTMRLFRQKTEGDWEGVFSDIKKEILLKYFPP